ncbi:unnamed protein product [Diabrotica balteata]|uniref:Uncharacterized protein n=1 Tax=Diabrotica balteata TaxID=107213 RepID=A0A9P0DTP1_DIABA|nr:unnamed protein product [Diabrotica balteata]
MSDLRKKLKQYILTEYKTLYTEEAVNPERQRVKELARECQKESGSTVDELENIRHGRRTPDTGKQALCVSRKVGSLDRDGHIVPDTFNKHVNALTAFPERRKELKDKCGKTNGENAEERAINFVKCMQSVLAKTPV